MEASRIALKSRSIVPVGVWRLPGWRLDVFGSSTSSSWRILEALGGSRSLQNQDSLALSVSGRLTSHDLSCLSVFGGLPECSEVTIYRACRCLEASRMASSRVRERHKPLLEDLGRSWGLSEPAKSRFIGPVGVWEAHKSRSVSYTHLTLPTIYSV